MDAVAGYSGRVSWHAMWYKIVTELLNWLHGGFPVVISRVVLMNHKIGYIFSLSGIIEYQARLHTSAFFQLILFPWSRIISGAWNLIWCLQIGLIATFNKFTIQDGVPLISPLGCTIGTGNILVVLVEGFTVADGVRQRFEFLRIQDVKSIGLYEVCCF